MARIVKTLIPEHGHPHREHRSKRGRSRMHRDPYRFTRRYHTDRAIGRDTEVEIRSALDGEHIWQKTTKIRDPRIPARTRAVHRRNLLLRKEALLRRNARTKARDQREALKSAQDSAQPAADRRLAPIVPGRRDMEEAYIKRLIELGQILGDAARERIEAGALAPHDLKLISSASHMAGFIDAMRIADEKTIRA